MDIDDRSCMEYRKIKLAQIENNHDQFALKLRKPNKIFPPDRCFTSSQGTY